MYENGKRVHSYFRKKKHQEELINKFIFPEFSNLDKKKEYYMTLYEKNKYHSYNEVIKEIKNGRIPFWEAYWHIQKRGNSKKIAKYLTKRREKAMFKKEFSRDPFGEELCSNYKKYFLYY